MGLELLGLDPGQRKRALAEKRRLGTPSVVQALLAGGQPTTPDAGGPALEGDAGIPAGDQPVVNQPARLAAVNGNRGA